MSEDLFSDKEEDNEDLFGSPLQNDDEDVGAKSVERVDTQHQKKEMENVNKDIYELPNHPVPKDNVS